MYVVIVGNVGKVCETPHLAHAIEVYDRYVHQSNHEIGSRVSGEDVTLFDEDTGEVVREHDGSAYEKREGETE